MTVADSLLADVDALVHSGAWTSRSEAVRVGLELAIRHARSRSTDAAFAAGWAERPLGDDEGAELTARSIASIEPDPWDRWWTD